jgi:hypothetical protein
MEVGLILRMFICGAEGRCARDAAAHGSLWARVAPQLAGGDTSGKVDPVLATWSLQWLARAAPKARKL